MRGASKHLGGGKLSENEMALLTTPEPPIIALNWQGIDRALEDPAAPPVISITASGLGAECAPRDASGSLSASGGAAEHELLVANAQAGEHGAGCS
eukprot:jgi/Tetstr1/421691/TSEL_012629.t1